MSIAGGVAGLDKLRGVLRVNLKQAVDGFAKLAIGNPRRLLQKWNAFVRAGRSNPATPAHRALTQIAIMTKSKVFTENIDRFHERAGLQPIRISRAWLTRHGHESWLRDLDVIITAGLARDDRRFLAWYKGANPKGRIVAINMHVPSYLGQRDSLLRGDVQIVLPQLAQRLIRSGAPA
jgi:NAD-dependent SIR2 family protein deacetylase